MKMKVSDLLSDENKWCKGQYAMDANGKTVHEQSELASKWCIAGAAMRCEYTSGEHRDLQRRMLVVTKDTIANWQDRPECTFVEVRELLLSIGH